MRWLKLYTTILLLIVISSATVNAQDFTFSQFYHTNFLYNPALTGHIPSSYRLAILYRQQWLNIDGGFKNYAFTADINFNNKNSGTKPAFGLAAMQEEGMEGRLKQTNILFSSALHQEIGSGQKYFLSIGMQGGLFSRRFNTTNLKFGSGLLGGINEIITTPNSLNFDLRVGVNWSSYLNNDQMVLNLGVGYLHLGGLKETTLLRVSTIEPAVVVNGSMDWHIKKDKILLMPSFLVMSQGGSRQYNFGTSFFYRMNENYNFFTGVHWRVKDAIIPSIGAEYKTVRVTMSYDFTTSALRSSSFDGIEISIGYNGQLARTGSFEKEQEIRRQLTDGL